LLVTANFNGVKYKLRQFQKQILREGDTMRHTDDARMDSFLDGKKIFIYHTADNG